MPAARLTYQKRLSASASLPNPWGGGDFTSQGTEAQRGNLVLFLQGSTAHTGLTIYPSVCASDTQAPYMVWLFAQVTPRGLERSGFKNQQLIQNRVIVTAAFYVLLGARHSAKPCTVCGPGGSYCHLPILRVNKLRAVHRSRSCREAELEFEPEFGL